MEQNISIAERIKIQIDVQKGIEKRLQKVLRQIDDCIGQSQALMSSDDMIKYSLGLGQKSGYEWAKFLIKNEFNFVE